MKNILVIDDDDQFRQMLRQILEREGYKVWDAADGKAGIELYRKSPADLIIADIIMPEKEGVETIIELKRDFPNVKIIAVSGGGRVGADYLGIAEKLGVDCTFRKPFDRRELLGTIDKLLGAVVS